MTKTPYYKICYLCTVGLAQGLTMCITVQTYLRQSEDCKRLYTQHNCCKYWMHYANLLFLILGQNMQTKCGRLPIYRYFCYSFKF